MWRCFPFGATLTLGLLTRTFDARGVEPVAGSSPHASHLRVAAVQMRSTRDLATNVHKIEEYLARCANDGARVVVFPECALTGYFDDAFMQAFSAEQLADAEQQVAEACRKHKIYAIIGTPHRDGSRLYNSSVVISPSGKVLARYHKIQLAEKWPTAGEQLLVFQN